MNALSLYLSPSHTHTTFYEAERLFPAIYSPSSLQLSTAIRTHQENKQLGTLYYTFQFGFFLPLLPPLAPTHHLLFYSPQCYPPSCKQGYGFLVLIFLNSSASIVMASEAQTIITGTQQLRQTSMLDRYFKQGRCSVFLLHSFPFLFFLYIFIYKCNTLFHPQ